MSDPGLTPEEIKQRFDEKTLREAKTFQPQGVSRQAALDYLESPEGKLYRQRLIEASPNTPLNKLQERAIDQITSGVELPRMETIHEPLVKIVPKGSTPTGHSPFWAKEGDLDAAVKEGKNLSQHFALPVASESTQYDVYKITPKAPTEVFVNTVAPTTELDGEVRKAGGATQYLTPNRNLYQPHEFVKTVDNRLHIPLQRSPTQQAPAPNEPHPTTSSAANGPDGAKVHGIRGVAKAAGVAGTAYGVYQGVNDTRDAIDTARSNREQWVRGAEAGADVATRGAVTGVAATVGAIPGAAAGALTSPVTGPVGPVVGGLATGGAAAVGADKLYEDSRLQQFSKYLGGKGGQLGYDYISKEGRLLREVNGLKQDLQTASDPAERTRLQTRLDTAREMFAAEAERNGRYFDGRAGIDKAWEQNQAKYPKVDKDDVNGALAQHIDAGKRPDEAARAALSDAVHEKYPRAMPHHPVEDYRALSNEQLAEKHRQYVGEVSQGRANVLALAANKDSHNNIDKGWPKPLAEQRQAARVQDGLNQFWKDTGHLGAIREAYKERGMPPPELPAELRTQGAAQRSPAPGTAAPSAVSARDALRPQENLDRSREGAALSPEQQRHLQLARDQLGPALSARGHTPEQIERVCAAAVCHAQQHAERGPVKAFHLGKDGERVAVVQERAPMSEMSASAAQQHSSEQHLAQAQSVAQKQSAPTGEPTRAAATLEPERTR